MKKVIFGLGTAVLISSGFAHASQFTDYAKVVDVETLTKTVRVSQPRQECWNEQVTHQVRGNDGGGMIVGGILGGVLGNRIGKGNGNKAAIAAGTILGASIGQSMSREPRRSYTTNEQRCQTVNDYYEEQRVTGYRVAYRYSGHTYYTNTSQHPGDRIPVRVSVSPAY